MASLNPAAGWVVVHEAAWPANAGNTDDRSISVSGAHQAHGDHASISPQQSAWMTAVRSKKPVTVPVAALEQQDAAGVGKSVQHAEAGMCCCCYCQSAT